MLPEMEPMKSSDVYDEIPIQNCSQEDIDNALDGTWVKRGKTATKQGARIRMMFLLAPWDWSHWERLLLMNFHDVGLQLLVISVLRFFVHLWLNVLMKPPSEYYPTGNCLWFLKQAMYWLKQAPELWQTRFAKMKTELTWNSQMQDCVVCVINWFVKPLNGQRSSLRKSYWRLKANWNLKPL